MSTADEGYKKFLDFRRNVENNFNEADTRSKIIEPLFINCLGWEENDLRREVPVCKGFIDYSLRLGNNPILLIEAKESETHFTLPMGRIREYKLNGTITTDSKISKVIEQVAKYAFELGISFSVITNGHQFIIFQNFITGGKWRDGKCVIFRSLDDIRINFSLFWNLLSKDSIMLGNLSKFFSGGAIAENFVRVYDSIHNPDSVVGKNKVAGFIRPLREKIFEDIIDDSQIDVLKNCYIGQETTLQYDQLLKSRFDKLPHYANKYKIDDIISFNSKKNKFEVSFDKCAELLRTSTPSGSLILLLGGIGSGKTTFIHHFFKIVEEDRSDIITFFIDFAYAPPELEYIEKYIYENIIDIFKREYKYKYFQEFKDINIEDFEVNSKDIQALMACLLFKSYVVSLVLDNVDHHGYTSPLYQERLFEIAQKITSDLRTITILNLREESYFKVTKSGILDAFIIPTFHIASPNFEQLIRARLNYVLQSLESGDINNIIKSDYDEYQNSLLKIFFIAINNSIRESRPAGKDILNFINSISGGDMRQSLRLFNTFLTSGNTDVEKIFGHEVVIPKDAPSSRHYNVPLHDIVTSIMLGDYKYYNSNKSFIINVFQVHPQYSNSQFMYVKILKYLYDRKNYFYSLEDGYIPINDFYYEAEKCLLNQKTIQTVFSILGKNKLVEYDNQLPDGFNTANYVKITRTGIYYLTEFVHNFTYLDSIWGDTFISDDNTHDLLKSTIWYDDIKLTEQRVINKLKRTDIFLSYLKNKEIKEFSENPAFYNSELFNKKFMEYIIDKFEKNKEDILKRIE